MPALLKGFIDRTFLPGFAFRYHEKGPYWDKLLKGLSGRIIITMDTPIWYNWLVYRNANVNAMAVATLGFCGIGPVRTNLLSSLKSSTPAKRTRWLALVRQYGNLDTKS